MSGGLVPRGFFVSKRELYQDFLFESVAAGGTCCGACGCGPASHGKGESTDDAFAEFSFHTTPCAHILGFFLHPEYGCVGLVCVEHFVEIFGLQWIELFDAENGDVVASFFFSCGVEFVVYFAGAHDDAFDVSGVAFFVFENASESPVDEIVECGGAFGFAQQAFGGEDDEGFSPGSPNLPSEQVKHLSGRGRGADLEIVFGCESQESFDSSA
mgnify:CR=1 FL=1